MKRILLAASIAVVLMCGANLAASTPVHAAEPEWKAGTSRGTAERLSKEPVTPNRQLPGCVEQSFAVPSRTLPLRGCVLESTTYSLALVYNEGDARTYQHRSWFHVRIGSDQKFYPVSGFGVSYNIAYIPQQTQGLVLMKSEGYNYGLYYQKYDDFVSRLSRTLLDSGNGTSVGYIFRSADPDHTVAGADGQKYIFNLYTISENGRYFYGQIDGLGAILINTSDNTARRVSNNYIWLYAGVSSVAAVSDTGQHVAVSSYNSSDSTTTITSISESCGTSDTATRHPSYTVCPSISLQDDVKRTINVTSPLPMHIYKLGFLDNHALELKIGHTSGYWHIKLEAGGYVAPERLEYLALGDSYSSGEGDIPGDYYRKYTKAQGDTQDCHLSSRSYPYLLRDHYKIQPSQMQSVACSGAKVVHDYLPSPNGYLGQEDRLRYLNVDIEAIYNQSISNFTPGYIPQLEFVKKYKPRYVTLTGGGNDVGFGSYLSYCADAYIVSFTCESAKSGTFLNTLLNNSIDTQYFVMKRLLTKIHDASPDTQVYIIGYPNFISSTGYCNLRAWSLNSQERRVIEDAVTKLNNILKKVSTDTGAVYIDIESSLVGGRLCENSGQYMTGIIEAKLTDGDVSPSSFHPNSEGHKKIADAIESSGQLFIKNARPADNPTPVIPGKTTIPMNGAFKRSILGGSTGIYRISSYSFDPSSKVQAKLHSDPLDLGEFITNPDGSLDVTLKIPEDFPIGTHVLTLEGKSFSQEDITYYQFIDIVRDKATDAPISEENNTINNPSKQSPPPSIIIQQPQPHNSDSSKLRLPVSVDSTEKNPQDIISEPVKSIAPNSPTSNTSKPSPKTQTVDSGDSSSINNWIIYSAIILAMVVSAWAYYAKKKITKAKSS